MGPGAQGAPCRGPMCRSASPPPNHMQTGSRVHMHPHATVLSFRPSQPHPTLNLGGQVCFPEPMGRSTPRAGLGGDSLQGLSDPQAWQELGAQAALPAGLVTVVGRKADLLYRAVLPQGSLAGRVALRGIGGPARPTEDRCQSPFMSHSEKGERGPCLRTPSSGPQVSTHTARPGVSARTAGPPRWTGQRARAGCPLAARNLSFPTIHCGNVAAPVGSGTGQRAAIPRWPHHSTNRLPGPRAGLSLVSARPPLPRLGALGLVCSLYGQVSQHGPCGPFV